MIKTNLELVEAAKDLQKHKTLYVYGGCFDPLTESEKQRHIKAYKFNAQRSGKGGDRYAKIMAATDDTFGGDCCYVLKALLWGWTGDKTKPHGGAVIGSNGVPNLRANDMIQKCTGLSSNFKKIEVGEAVWVEGHIGLYIGDGKVIECTYSGTDGVQITEAWNIKQTEGKKGRMWTAHGKLPYIEYVEEKKAESIKLPVLKKGSKGKAVKVWQIIIGADADGDFGGKTFAATKTFQKTHGLEADGIAGEKSWQEGLKTL